MHTCTTHQNTCVYLLKMKVFTHMSTSCRPEVQTTPSTGSKHLKTILSTYRQTWCGKNRLYTMSFAGSLAPKETLPRRCLLKKISTCLCMPFRASTEWRLKEIRGTTSNFQVRAALRPLSTSWGNCWGSTTMSTSDEIRPFLPVSNAWCCSFGDFGQPMATLSGGAWWLAWWIWILVKVWCPHSPLDGVAKELLGQTISQHTCRKAIDSFKLDGVLQSFLNFWLQLIPKPLNHFGIFWVTTSLIKILLLFSLSMAPRPTKQKRRILRSSRGSAPIMNNNRQ